MYSKFLHKTECTRLPACYKVIPVHDYPRKVSSTRKENKSVFMFEEYASESVTESLRDSAVSEGNY